MRRQLRKSLLGLALSCWAFAGNAAGRHPFSTADLLQLEDVGRTVLTAGARELIFERIPPYQSAPNLETLYSPASDRSALAKIYIGSLSGVFRPETLFPQSPGSGYWIGGLSPLGTKLAVFSLFESKVSAGVVDLKSRVLVQFNFTPNYNPLVQRPVWISERELIYASMEDGEQPAIVDRSRLAAEIQSRWATAFRGKQPSATSVYSSSTENLATDSFRKGRLLRVDVTNGQSTLLTEGYFVNLQLSPTRRFVGALKEGGAVQPNAGSFVWVGDRHVRRQLVIVDLANPSRVITPCNTCDVVPGTLTWSTDSQTLAFFARPIGASVHEASLFEYSTVDGRISAVETEHFRPACIRFATSRVRAVATSHHWALLGHVTEKRRDTADFGACRADEHDQWYLVPRAGGPPSLMASGDDETHVLGAYANSIFFGNQQSIWRVSADGRRVSLMRSPGEPLMPWGDDVIDGIESDEAVFTGLPVVRSHAAMHSRTMLLMLDLSSGRIVRIQKPSADAELLNYDLSAATALFRQNSAAGSRFLLVHNSHRPRLLFDINSQLNEVAVSGRVTMTYALPGHGTLESTLLLPPDWSSSQRYPVILYVYPGSTGVCESCAINAFDPFNLQLLAARGYLVLFAAAPRALIRSADGPTRALTSVVLAAVDRAIEAGYADPRRVGIIGFSQGYNAALQVITETDRIRAAVVAYGISDFASHYGASALRYRIDGVGSDFGNAGRYESELSDNWMGTAPWSDPARYIRNSPVFFADRITAPVLIIHSDFDVFPLEQSDELFGALFRLRKDAAYVTYWGEGHWNLSPANITDIWSRIIGWYDTKLMN